VPLTPTCGAGWILGTSTRMTCGAIRPDINSCHQRLSSSASGRGSNVPLMPPCGAGWILGTSPRMTYLSIDVARALGSSALETFRLCRAVEQSLKGDSVTLCSAQHKSVPVHTADHVLLPSICAIGNSSLIDRTLQVTDKPFGGIVRNEFRSFPKQADARSPQIRRRRFLCESRHGVGERDDGLVL
jgi:hypothetical protein